MVFFLMEEQQFYHVLIIPAGIKIAEVKDVFVFSKDPKSSENKLKVLIYFRSIASHGAITFCKMYLKIKRVASPTPHCGMMCLVIMVVGQSPLLHQFTIKNTKGTILEILPNSALKRICTMLLQAGHSLIP